MTNGKKQVLTIADGNFNTRFEVTFFAENNEHKVNLLSIEAHANESTKLALLLGRALQTFEIKAPLLLKSARIIRTQKESIKGTEGKSTGEYQQVTRARAIKASELRVSFKVLTDGQNWTFGTFENVPLPFNGSAASMHDSVTILLENLFATLSIHAMTDESAESWLNSTFAVRGLNKAETLQLRKERTKLLLQAPVSEYLKSTPAKG